MYPKPRSTVPQGSGRGAPAERPVLLRVPHCGGPSLQRRPGSSPAPQGVQLCPRIRHSDTTARQP